MKTASCGRCKSLIFNGLAQRKVTSGLRRSARSEREIPCELALLAMGFLYPQKEGMLDQLGVETTGVGNVRASERSYQTTISKVFAAGDMRRGQSLVVWAISEGRECARKVDEYLMGKPLLERRMRPYNLRFNE